MYGWEDQKLILFSFPQLDQVFVLLSRLPPKLSGKLEHDAVKLLYYDLPHPPSTHMGQEYQFRTWDGSNNSFSVPDMGRSFTPYSRSCSGTRPLPAYELPDPGLVFDMLIRRDKVRFVSYMCRPSL